MKYIKLLQEQVPTPSSISMELLQVLMIHKPMTTFSYRAGASYFLPYLLTGPTDFFTTVKPSRDYNKWYI